MAEPTNSYEQDLATALESVVDPLASNPSPSTGGTTPSTNSVSQDLSSLPQPATTTIKPLDSNFSSTVSSPVEPAASTLPEPTPVAQSINTEKPDGSGPLDSIKKEAIVELRPLVDKLSISPEEKFDTYLLLIRSTDDADLIGPAHETAKEIEDETRRAEALLDIIKEIDYLSQQKAS